LPLYRQQGKCPVGLQLGNLPASCCGFAPAHKPRTNKGLISRGVATVFPAGKMQLK